MRQVNILQEFLVRVGFNTDQRSLSQMKAGLKTVGKVVAGLAASAGAALAATGAMMKNVAKELDAVSDASARIGISAEELVRWQHSAALMDSSAEAAVSSLQGLSRVMGEASLGIGRGAQAFNQLGVSIRKENGDLMNVTEMMATLGDHIRDMKRTEQLAVLQRLGIDPTMLQTVLTGNKKYGKELTDVYKAFNVNLEEAAANSSDYMDELTRMEAVGRAMKQAFGLTLIKEFGKEFGDARKSLVQMVAEVSRVAIPAFVKFVRVIVDFTRKVVKFVKENETLVKTIAAVVAAFWAFGKVVPVLKGVFAAMQALALLVTRHPVLAAITAIGAALVKATNGFGLFKSEGEEALKAVDSEASKVADTMKGVDKTITESTSSLKKLDTYLAGKVRNLDAWLSRGDSYEIATKAVAAGLAAGLAAGVATHTIAKLIGKIGGFTVSGKGFAKHLGGQLVKLTGALVNLTKVITPMGAALTLLAAAISGTTPTQGPQRSEIDALLQKARDKKFRSLPGYILNSATGAIESTTPRGLRNYTSNIDASQDFSINVFNPNNALTPGSEVDKFIKRQSARQTRNLQGLTP